MEPDEPPPPAGGWDGPFDPWSNRSLGGSNATSLWQEPNCSSLPVSSLPEIIGSTYALAEFYCAATLILVCVVSVLNNACVLLSTCWIKRRPLSTTMRISLSLTGADTIASFFLGVSYFLNNFLNSILPPSLDDYQPILWKGTCYRRPPERLTCVKLTLEALRLGAVLVTMLHLLALASNHYLGALRPLQSHVRHAYLVVGLCTIWIVPEATLLAYFASFENDGFRAPGNSCGYQFLTYYDFHITFSLSFFFVLILMVCIYVHIYIIVQRHERNRHRFRRTGSSHHQQGHHLGGHHLGGHQRAETRQLNGGRSHKQVQRTATDPGGWGGDGLEPAEPNGTTGDHGAAANSLMRSARSRRGGSPQFRRNKKAIVTTLFILGSYLIGWMPGVISFMLVCDKDCLIPRETISNSITTLLVFWFVNMLIVIKTLANSFIYTSRMKEIKEARRSMCNALARRCCRFLPQSADPARGALFGGPPTDTTCGVLGSALGLGTMGGVGHAGGSRPDRGSVYSRSSTRRLNLNGIGHHGRRHTGLGLAQSDV